MKKHFYRILVALIIFSSTGALIPRICAASNYEIADLGTLGENYSTAYGINKRGQIVGGSKTALGETHAFLYAKGVMADLGTLGGTESVAYDMNESGRVVGINRTGNYPYGWGGMPLLPGQKTRVC